MAEPASELQMAKERIGKLNARMKEARRVAETTTDGAERRRQLERLRILKDMYKDCREEIARLEGRILAEQKNHLHIDAVFNTNRVWSDLRGMTWGSLDGLTWSDIMQARDGAQTGHQRQLLIDLMNDSLRSCTERQRAYIHAYYSQQLAQDEIAEEFGGDWPMLPIMWWPGCLSPGVWKTVHLTTSSLYSRPRCLRSGRQSSSICR